MQEQHVDAIEAQRLEAAFEAPSDRCVDVGRRHRAELTLRRDAHARRRPSAERRTDHRFGLTTAVEGRHVEQRDAAGDGGVHRRDRFVAIGRSPHLAETAAAERQAAHWPKLPNRCVCIREPPT